MEEREIKNSVEVRVQLLYIEVKVQRYRNVATKS